MWHTYDINSRMRYIKYCLILFTCLFVLSGVSFIIVGGTINVIYGEYSHFLHMKYFSPAILLTSIGFVIFLVACLGLAGALKESTCLILLFGFSLGVIFILQISAGITNHFLMDTVDGELQYSINKTMYNYSSNNKSAGQMDYIQENFRCCGLESPKDWDTITGTLPPSCCAETDNTTDICLYFYSKGCLPTLINITQYSGRIFAITTSILSIMHLGGMFFAFYLGHIMRGQKIARDARKWLIRDQLLNQNDFEFNAKTGAEYYS